MCRRHSSSRSRTTISALGQIIIRQAHVGASTPAEAFRLTRSTTNIVPAWLVKPPRMPFETQPKTHPNRQRYLKCQTITPLSPAGPRLDRIPLIKYSPVHLLP